eukprot:TRINITY_DN33787_c0_g1_i1.p2 TRINITY_DN33787_c0_g1~~TRINITY_DN33787_c0_g1_i1.p2  ORF type:complete len:62 (-),score=2.49 TRINITY_DN33787_c0_g1_i1:105-290(-)
MRSGGVQQVWLFIFNKENLPVRFTSVVSLSSLSEGEDPSGSRISGARSSSSEANDGEMGEL